MPACLIRSLGFATLPVASLKMNEDLLLPQSTFSTLRRTLSADMSSEKWISQTGIKKVESVENLHLHFHDNHNNDNENRGAFEEISKEEAMDERPKQADIWSSIISQKAIEEEANQGSVPPPYVHPLVKRSASTLSEKSLEICTESLGSETGSDGFSSYPPCEGDSEHEEIKDIADVDVEEEAIAKEITEPLKQEEEEVRVYPVRCVNTIKKAAFVAARSLPPPLPSLAHRGDGSNVQMRSHRQDGRLVLEAVSVPTHACLRAERQEGRLLLLFSGSNASDSEPAADMNTEEEDDEEEEEVVLYDECDHQQGDLMEEDEEDEDQESDFDEEEEEEYASLGDYSGAVGHKFLELTRNSTPPWPRRLNKVVTTLDEEEEEAEEEYMEVRQSPMNPYVYSWRSKAGPAVVAVAAGAAQVKEHEETGINKLLQVDRHYGKSAVVEVVVDAKRAGKGWEDLVPLFLKGCNLQQQQPAKKSLLMWEPRCIAT